ncbi:MAG: DinB family protein [Bacteroidota bacterium]
MQPRSAPELLDQLTKRTEQNLSAARRMLALDQQTLHLRPRPTAWNALECLAHLNHYSDYYLPEIRRRIKETNYRENTATFTSSRLGNYFAAGMKPGPKIRKISTFKSANPRNFGQVFGTATIEEFITKQEDTLELLRMAREVDLTRTKTGISITNLIKLRLGDTLRVVIYHNWRHIEQAEAAMASAQPSAALA